MALAQSTPVTFGKNDVEFIECKPQYSGFFSLNLYRFRYRLFNGGISGEVTREIFEHAGAAILLAYDPQRDEVILVEQLRIAAINRKPSPWLLEMIAGIMEKGETAEQVVRREAQEEAGIKIKRCKQVLSYLASPGYSSEYLSIMVGEVDATSAKGVHGLAEENEDILVHVVSRIQAYHWVESGVIDNAASVIALQWLALHHESLREEWKS